jgi:DNA-binding transcriptional LysR family regulator
MDEVDRIERRLKLHDLRVLMSVVQHGSMAKAAEHLATSQPAVSRAIADLEYSLAVRLLDRGPRGIVPTPYGRALIKRSITVFDELRLGVKDLEFLADPSAGEVRVAAPIVLAAGFLADVIDQLTQRYPRVICHLMILGGYDQAVHARHVLEQRDVDLVVQFNQAPIAEDGMETELLYADPLSIVVSMKNPVSRRRGVKLVDLMDEPWTLPPPDSVVGATHAEMFRAAGLDPPAATVVNSSGLARLALVARGRFLTIIPESSLRFADMATAIKALPINLPQIHRGVAIATLKNRTLTPVTQLFVDCARELAKPMATGKTGSARRG